MLRAGGRRWSRRARGVRGAGCRRVTAAGRVRKAMAAFCSVILPTWQTAAAVAAMITGEAAGGGAPEDGEPTEAEGAPAGECS